MKKYVLTFIILLIYSSIITAQNAGSVFNSDGFWYTYKGTLGEENIYMTLYFTKNHLIKGSYYVDQSEAKTMLIGAYYNNNQMILQEYGHTTIEGHFIGKVQSNDSEEDIKGIWDDTSAQQEKTFTLKMLRGSGGTLNDQYLDLFGTDNDVESFIKKMKSAILEKDIDWLAHHINFPIEVAIAKHKRITLTNQDAFRQYFTSIFHNDFLKQIKSFNTMNLFSNHNGVMFGNGQIWIQNKQGSTEQNYDYAIKEIYGYNN